MAANSPGLFIGTAPKANYHLIRTEIEGSESLLEEYLWMCGAEYADSVGADIINSSLGYTVFDDEAQNHAYSDMNGNSTIVTRAADMAASKGILVVNSAGNSGNKPWQFIGAPADGDSVLSVGAVDENQIWAEFSSIGPTADDRIKPNIVAQGKNTIFTQIDGNIVSGNGTSFSSPIIAGLAACLWQSKPSLNNMQLLESIEKSGSYAYAPNLHYGYGLPDFDLAMHIAESIIVLNEQDGFLINLYPNPFIDRIRLLINAAIPESIEINIFDLNGKILSSKEFYLTNGFNLIDISQFNFISSGIYLLQLKGEHSSAYRKIIKID
jgi:subtilisin family serine protease